MGLDWWLRLTGCFVTDAVPVCPCDQRSEPKGKAVDLSADLHSSPHFCALSCGQRSEKLDDCRSTWKELHVMSGMGLLSGRGWGAQSSRGFSLSASLHQKESVEVAQSSGQSAFWTECLLSWEVFQLCPTGTMPQAGLGISALTAALMTRSQICNWKWEDGWLLSLLYFELNLTVSPNVEFKLQYDFVNCNHCLRMDSNVLYHSIYLSLSCFCLMLDILHTLKKGNMRMCRSVRVFVCVIKLKCCESTGKWSVIPRWGVIWEHLNWQRAVFASSHRKWRRCMALNHH